MCVRVCAYDLSNQGHNQEKRRNIGIGDDVAFTHLRTCTSPCTQVHKCESILRTCTRYMWKQIIYMQQVRKLCFDIRNGYTWHVQFLHCRNCTWRRGRYLVPLWIEQYRAHAVTQCLAVALQVRVRLRAVTVQDGGVATETHTQWSVRRRQRWGYVIITVRMRRCERGISAVCYCVYANWRLI